MPRRVDHQQRREQTAFAVWTVIAESGIDAVSLRRVAAAAGISLGQVQHYFASKDELLQHACRTVLEISAARFVERTSGADPLEAARALVVQALPGNEVDRIGTAVWQAFMTRAATDPALRALIADAVAGAIDELARLLAAARSDGQLDPPVAIQPAARALFALSYGLAQQVMISAITVDEATAAADAAFEVIASPREHT